MNVLASLSFGPDGGGDYLVLLLVLILGVSWGALRRFERQERGEDASASAATPEPWHYVGTPGEPPFENGWANASYRPPYDHELDPAWIVPAGYRVEGGSPCAS